jgi:hypothetical protein
MRGMLSGEGVIEGQAGIGEPAPICNAQIC